MSDDETTVSPAPPGARAGSGPDLARRMDRMETRQEAQEAEVKVLSATVSRVELNQKHAEELNVLRFASLDTAVNSTKAAVDAVRADLSGFMKRIEGMLTGEVQTAQSKQAAEVMADYVKWRAAVDADRAIIYSKEQRQRIEDRLDEAEEFRTQIGTGLKIAGFVLGSGQVLAIIAAVAALANSQ